VVVDYLRGVTETAVVFNYFDYKYSRTQTARSLAANLLKQLLSQANEIPAEIELLYYHHLNRSTRPSLHELVACFIVCAASLPSAIFVVLDALDECEDTQRDGVIWLIRRLVEEKIKVFLTSRYHLEHTIRTKFCSMITFNISANDIDIQRYLVARLARDQPRLSAALKDEIINSVIAQAGGM
jgi:hypothetical protein